MLLSSLPDNARVWLFAAERDLSEEQQVALQETIRAFLQEWKSHGRPVPGEVDVLLNRVLVVGAHLSESEQNAGVSGCGIDSLSHAVEAAAAKLGFGWTNPLDVLYYDVGHVLQTVSRAEFRRRAGEGVVTRDSLALDLTSTSVGEVRKNGIERNVADSWHDGLLALTELA